jgi:alpha-L-arabinofuranosidase
MIYLDNFQRLFVNTEKVIADISGIPVGINVNYLRDEDENHGDARTLVDALKEMGAGHLRFPGGEKSDFHLFSKPPYDKPMPQVYGWYKGQTEGYRVMDFDSFMEKAKAVGALPHIVVGYDSFERTGITKEQYLENAVEWVRYANIVKGYGIIYWEIGNENWHNRTGEAGELAEVVCRFSKAMKQVDPSIKIGASGNSRAWWKEFLGIAAKDIDFLTVSQYSCFNWKGYDYYVDHQSIDLTEQVTTALNAIDEFVPEEKERLKVIVSELNSMDYSEGGWSPDNNLGHAIVTFDIMGQLLKNNRVEYAMIWNTRWIAEKKPDVLWYALGSVNELLPPGKVLSIWGNFLSDKLVHITGADKVVTYASIDSKSGRLKLFLLNKAYEQEKLSVQISGRRYSKGSMFCLSGSGPEDKNPAWSSAGSVSVNKDLLPEIDLPAVSITVIDLE